MKWREDKHYQVSANSPDWIMAAMAAKEVGMTPDEELYAKFYNEERVLVKDMDHIQKREHREELQKIAFEARVRHKAVDDDIREDDAKSNKKDWLVTDTTRPVSDLINAPKVRASRMSKMDKLRNDLQKAHLDEATINEMIRKMESRATDKTLKTVTFSKPSTEVTSVQVKPAASKPFDPTTLFGK
jgi:hypothetical protein